jgi:pyruvate/2-oxoglutarate dehydrogenase complex dihydrolipoamide acyltransferase (E2) component
MTAPPDARIVRYTPLRRFLALTLRSAARTPIIHGLVEFDVTEARRRIAAHREQTGEALSFTAFIVGCVAAAVLEHPEVHAMRLGSRRLMIFNDVDVGVLVEREMEGRRQPIIAIVRAANRLPLRDIHAAIRRAQVEPPEQAWTAFSSFSFIPVSALRWLWPLLWWIVRHRPVVKRRFRGTIGVTALGMFAHTGGWGIPISDATDITVGGIVTRPAWIDGAVVPREMLAITLSVDHGLVDGAIAARFIESLRRYVESAHGLDGI